MRTPLYRQALSHSWQLAWKHKLLWIFGMFAAFLGQMGLLDLLGKVSLSASNRVMGRGGWGILGVLRAGTGEGSSITMAADGWVWLVWLSVIILGGALFMIFVSVVSQGALIKSAAQSTKIKKFPDVGKAWHAGTTHFWRLLAINIIKKILICILGLVVAWSTMNVMLSLNGLDILLFIVLFILVAIVGMILSFLAIYAAGYVVVEEYSLGHALVAAWNLFLSHWLVSIEVGLIILGLNIVLSVVALLGFFVLFLPTLITWFIAILTVNAMLWQAGLIVGLLFVTLFVIFLGSVFTVFVTSVWTYLFMKMHHKGIGSRVLGILSHKKK